MARPDGRATSAPIIEEIVTQTGLKIEAPLMHDSPQEMGKPFDPKDWKHECEPIRSKTACPPQQAWWSAITADLPGIHQHRPPGKSSTTTASLAWQASLRLVLRKLNGVRADGIGKGQPKLDTAIDAAEMILTLALKPTATLPVKAWKREQSRTDREHRHL